MIKNIKPLGRKNYGSIGHLPCSRMGSADRKIPDGQAEIATLKARDKHDVVIVQEKLDGSNVGVCMVNGKIFALGRSGYEAKTSKYKMHHHFSDWVYKNESRFKMVLNDRQRICGEWLTTAHSTKYNLPHEPFVAFDLIDEENKRTPFVEFMEKVRPFFITPHVVNKGSPISVEDVMGILGVNGFHGASEQIEGAIWRVERNGVVDFLCKYVRPDKIDGKYFGVDNIIMNTWQNYEGEFNYE